ncbi:MAG TPA: STAS domain-containing protein [Methanocorpusculum sp.]|nr:STAS domain-containing protein [Methanocorpusculum sp.]
MDILIENDGRTVIIKPAGNIDFVSAPELDDAVVREAADAEKLVFDFSAVNYIASAGIRTILNADELMESKGGIKIVHANPNVMAVFEMTGINSIIDVE